MRWHPLLTLVIRIDTLESHSNTPAVAGYSLLNVFAQPPAPPGHNKFFPYNLLLPRADALAGEYVLNSGGFQLPLFQGPPGRSTPLSADSLVGSGVSRVPCATVLVRIVPAPRNPSNGAVLSRTAVASAQWASTGLLRPALTYG